MKLVDDLLKGNRVALSKTISKIENDEPEGEEAVGLLFKHTGRTYHIGVTGPPGAGKSTLVDRLANRILDRKEKLGIIAVDPTSSFSGGALLGDRVRMSDLSTREGVFIRSMATRGSLGGLATTTKDVALCFDAFGMDYVVIETIGVGQVELDIADTCDTTIVVLVPESGDSIQAMKAGLMEIADIIVVNKGDREGAEQMVAELKFISRLRERDDKWEYPILQTEAINDKGVDELLTAILSHKKQLKKTGKFELNRKRQIKLRVKELVEKKIKIHLEEQVLSEEDLNRYVHRAYKKKTTPFQIAEEIFKKIK